MKFLTVKPSPLPIGIPLGLKYLFKFYKTPNMASCLMSPARGLTTLQKRGSKSADIVARDLKSWETYFNT